MNEWKQVTQDGFGRFGDNCMENNRIFGGVLFERQLHISAKQMTFSHSLLSRHS